MLTFEQLEALRAIVRVGSFTSAAEEMFLSQPAISERIRHLEKALGAELFVRDGNRRPMRLTPAGAHVLRFADEVTTQLQRLRTRMRTCSSDVEPDTVKLACSMATARYVLPDVLDAYHLRYPNVHVSLTESVSSRIAGKVRSGEADIGILGIDHVPSRFRRVVLAQHNAVLIAAPDHPVLSDPDGWLTANGTCPMVCGGLNSGMRVAGERWAALQHLKFDVVVEATSLNVIKEVVIRGIALAILPEVTVKDEIRNGTLAVVPVRGMPLRWCVSAILDQKRSRPAVQAFLDVACLTSACQMGPAISPSQPALNALS